MNGQFDLGAVKPSHYFFAVALVLGILFGLIVPIQDDQNRLMVVIQWITQSVVPMALLVGSHVALQKNSRFSHSNPWIKLFLSGLVGSALYAPIALANDVMIEQEVIDNLALELLDEWFAVAPPVIICWIAINAPWLLGFSLVHKATVTSSHSASESEAKPVEEQPLDSKEPVSNFWALLSSDLGRDILYLKAELHYLKVVTEKGSELILYNLKDAVSEMPAKSGVLCHRSYWIALEHVERLEKKGREGLLYLQNGDTVPVSRNRFASVDAVLNIG